ncbi:hypothetical protein [Anaeromyxobacter oryzae]|uniref:Outer membrane protein beta-barrel domain-containing protein n=1 Tax=Anaeromyxobacter oryzae TaxID=2918170 RepID=A0ABM7WVB6_9BACT|nr:hypothetical protein [Anaeromyxobacter oryzae]BDG03422.1 hypothetical protein AMOR_24180 [Anaeromyxobacter oryzae]
MPALVLILLAAAAAPVDPADPAGSPTAQAMITDARASARGLVIELRSDFGFERLVEIEYAGGRRNTMHLNDGLVVALGWSFLPLAEGRLGTRAAVGFKVDLLRATNGSATFVAVPVDLMEALYAGPLRLGAGVSVLLAPRVAGSGFLDQEATTFRPAPGVLLDAEWIVAPRARTGIGLRASWYRFESSAGVRDAPSVGVLLRSDLDLARR